MKDSLVIMQAGRTAFVVSFDKKGTAEASFVRLDKNVAQEIKNNPEGMGLDVTTLSEGDENDDTDNVELIINSKKFSEDPTKVTTELFVSTALGVVCSTPIIGGVIEKILRKPVLKIATFLVGTIQSTASAAVDLATERKRTAFDTPIEKGPGVN